MSGFTSDLGGLLLSVEFLGRDWALGGFTPPEDSTRKAFGGSVADFSPLLPGAICPKFCPPLANGCRSLKLADLGRELFLWLWEEALPVSPLGKEL